MRSRNVELRKSKKDNNTPIRNTAYDDNNEYTYNPTNIKAIFPNWSEYITPDYSNYKDYKIKSLWYI